jgi:hypothetical protein
VEPKRYVVVGVQPRRDDDVQVGGRGNTGDPWDVAAQPDHGEVDDGVDAARLQLVEPIDGIGHPFVFVAPCLRVVQRDFRGHDEHVLVHERDADVGGIDWSLSGIQ